MKDYEFISYEAFPNDTYVKEVVEVVISGLVLPYCHMIKQDGGMYWAFPSAQATNNGVKKRFNGRIDSSSAKIKFDQAVEHYVNVQTGKVPMSAPLAATAQFHNPATFGVAPAAQDELPF